MQGKALAEPCDAVYNLATVTFLHVVRVAELMTGVYLWGCGVWSSSRTVSELLGKYEIFSD